MRMHHQQAFALHCTERILDLVSVWGKKDLLFSLEWVAHTIETRRPEQAKNCARRLSVRGFQVCRTNSYT